MQRDITAQRAQDGSPTLPPKKHSAARGGAGKQRISLLLSMHTRHPYRFQLKSQTTTAAATREVGRQRAKWLLRRLLRKRSSATGSIRYGKEWRRGFSFPLFRQLEEVAPTTVGSNINTFFHSSATTAVALLPLPACAVIEHRHCL